MLFRTASCDNFPKKFSEKNSGPTNLNNHCGTIVEQNLKYIIESCDGIQKFIDGHLMDVVHQVDPSITNDILLDLDDWDSSYEGIMDADNYDNKMVFGNDTELPPNLL